MDKVRELQRKLWSAAKRSRNRRFALLYDKVYRKDFLWEAWHRVRANGGAPGLDGKTIQAVEEHGVEEFLEGIQKDLKAGEYWPLPVRRHYIPKPDGKQRPVPPRGCSSSLPRYYGLLGLPLGTARVSAPPYRRSYPTKGPPRRVSPVPSPAMQTSNPLYPGGVLRGLLPRLVRSSRAPQSVAFTVVCSARPPHPFGGNSIEASSGVHFR